MLVLDRIAKARVKKTAEKRAAGQAGPPLRRIDGRHNLLVKELRRAFRQGEPTPEGHFAIEGVRIIDEAIRSGCRFRAVFFSEAAGERTRHILPQLSKEVEAFLLPDALFQSAALTEAPQGVAALVHLPKHGELNAVISRDTRGPIVVAAGIQDPGNLGTILRSAEAFGAGGVLLTEGTVSGWNSKVVRASAGSLFRLFTARIKLKEAVENLRAANCRLIATSSHNGTPISKANLTGRIALFIGNEGAGLPPAVMRELDEVVSIPQKTLVESLNAGVAASVVLYECLRQSQQRCPE
jgi:RNA methyltransferase, TrmH family